VDGVLTTLVEDGYDRARLFPVENKTVVTNPIAGCRNNRWEPVLRRHGVPFIPLPDVEWITYPFQSPLLKLNRIFPGGIEIPKMYVGKNVLHMPTQKVHGHSVTTGAIKNAFGGLLKEVRHYAHEFIHEVLVDLMYMQRELHPGVLAVMDGTVMGDGAGPRTMVPRVGNLIDQLIRRGPLRPLKRLLLHSPLVVWAPFASNVYHDWLWYPTIGRARIRAFAATPWGRLFERY
jgi:hypothetical protein